MDVHSANRKKQQKITEIKKIKVNYVLSKKMNIAMNERITGMQLLNQ